MTIPSDTTNLNAMGTINNLQIFERIHYLIQNKRTGSPKEFARKLKISERTLYRKLDELRSYGAIISYDYLSSSYTYENSFNLKLVIKNNHW